jgi:hypothetical protein
MGSNRQTRRYGDLWAFRSVDRTQADCSPLAMNWMMPTILVSVR